MELQQPGEAGLGAGFFRGINKDGTSPAFRG